MDSEKCIWKSRRDWYGLYWETECGNKGDLLGKTPDKFGMLFCFFCGAKLVQHG